jgi:hypothetical protein
MSITEKRPAHQNVSHKGGSFAETTPSSRFVEISPDFITQRDRALVDELKTKYAERGPLSETPWGLRVRNRTLAPFVQERYTPTSFAALTKTLADHGTLDIHPHNGSSVVIDGKERSITIVPATENQTHGDMSEQIWIRDEAQDARSLIQALKIAPDQGSAHYNDQKKTAQDILRGAIDLMSPQAQRKRYENIIQDPSLADDPENWPQIAINTEHLDSEISTPWRHNQEAFQMLGIATLDAIDNKILTVDDLAGDNKKFLSSMMPFLASVNFSERETVGSWEEISAIRTSVVAVETALLHTIQQHADKPEFAFMHEGFDRAKEHLIRNKDKTSFKDTDFNENTTFKEALGFMIDKGLMRIGEQLPHEAPSHGRDSAKYTAADAALLYLLDYDIPQLLAKKHIPIKAAGGESLEVDEIEDVILAEVGKLYDKETQGIIRYGAPDDPNPDSYLRNMYDTPGVQSEIKKMKKDLRAEAEAKGEPLNLEEKRRRREEIVPKGPAAAWTHFNAQLSAWAGRRYLETGKEFYLNRAVETFNRTVAMVTGEGEHHILPEGDGEYRVKPVESFRLTECIPTIITEDGERITFPSPNTQLDWAVTKTIEAAAMVTAALKKEQSDSLKAA